MDAPPPLLELAQIAKSFGPAVVLQGVSLALAPGEVLALAGENGAGKSTLSKIVCGLLSPSAGRMRLQGQPYAPGSRRQAEALGVRMVLQELGLIPTLTVAENLLIDRLPHRAGWLDRRRLHQEAAQRLQRVGLALAPDTPVAALGIGQQQMVEIARNLQPGTRVLILDEPTAMLTPPEIDHLFREIAQMKARGVAVLYISHRLEELMQIADTLAVLRDGRLVEHRPMRGVAEAEIVRAMVGREVSTHDARPARPRGALRLQAQGLGRGQAVREVSLQLHAGEVLGVAGLVGSGRTELLRLLFGADRADRGRLTLVDEQGAKVHEGMGWRSPMQAIEAGVGLVTEDRKSQGLLLPQSVRVNTTLADLKPLSGALGWLHQAAERREAGRWIEALRVRCTGSEQPVADLSGGNQQKVVFARWLRRGCRVLLLDEPTRGVDVGARADLYAELDRLAAEGTALLMVSSDLRELMALCDRIAVMSGGRLVATVERGRWSMQALLQAAFSETAGARGASGAAAASGAGSAAAAAAATQPKVEEPLP